MPAFAADTILHNGTIWRGHAEGTCSALAIWQGRVLATGDDDAVLPLRGPGTRMIDLGGRFATPGLNDDLPNGGARKSDHLRPVCQKSCFLASPSRDLTGGKHLSC